MRVRQMATPRHRQLQTIIRPALRRLLISSREVSYLYPRTSQYPECRPLSLQPPLFTSKPVWKYNPTDRRPRNGSCTITAWKSGTIQSSSFEIFSGQVSFEQGGPLGMFYDMITVLGSYPQVRGFHFGL